MSHGKRGRTHPMLYMFTGLFAGILIGFGTALMIQNQALEDIIPGLHGRSDTLEVGAKGDGAARHRSKPESLSGIGDQMESDQNIDLTNLPQYTDTSLVAEFPDDTVQTVPSDGVDMVRRDEMIGVKRVKLQIADETSSRKNISPTGSDTLLSALTSVKLPEGYFNEYLLEFWQNPINYKGYRVTRDKIVLFGLPVDQNYSIKLTEGHLILVAGRQQYALRESSTLSPLIPRRQ